MHTFYNSLNVVKMIKSERINGWNMVEMARRSTYRILVQKSQVKRLFRKLACKWKNNIRIRVGEAGSETVN